MPNCAAWGQNNANLYAWVKVFAPYFVIIFLRLKYSYCPVCFCFNTNFMERLSSTAKAYP